MGIKNKFGFDMNQGRQIDLDLADHRLADELARLVPSWRACINCGSCTATCPSGQNGGLNFRLILKLTTLGELSTLNTCLLCGKCQLVCPRGISTRFLSLQIMNKAREYGAAV